MRIEDFPPKIQFTYITMTKSAIIFKEMDKDKDFFLKFCDEIWNSMQLTDLEYLKSILDGKMKKDIQPYVDSYIKNSGQAERK